MKNINDSFRCCECGKLVSKAQKTCRNHCPFCFSSLHVDGDIPGDRSADCFGMMYPIAYEWKDGDYRILFSCVKCGKKHWNKRAIDDEILNLPEYIAVYRSKF